MSEKDHYSFLAPNVDFRSSAVASRFPLITSHEGRTYVLRRGPSPRLNEVKDVCNFISQEAEVLEHYGVNIVPFTPVVHLGSEGYSYITLVCDFVHGERYYESATRDRVILSGGLINYYKNKLIAGDNFLLDISHSRQYICGGIHNEPKKLYMVDIEPGQNTIVPDKFENRENKEMYGLMAMENAFNMGGYVVRERIKRSYMDALNSLAKHGLIDTARDFISDLLKRV